MTDYVHVGAHADTLADGTQIGPGSHVKASDLGPEDQYLIDEGRLLEDPGPQAAPLSKTELLDRAAALDIQGRTKMNADDLAAAVAAAEADNGGVA